MTGTLTQVTPTAAELDQVQQAIAAHVRTIDAHPNRREGAYPYCLFHPPGQPIRGTVMIFHGFSAKPHQMSRLASYLFDNGFNIYQCNLAGHALVNPAKNWPQIDLKPEYAEPLKQKVRQDPVLSRSINNFKTSAGSAEKLNRIQQLALTARLLAVEPRLLDIKQAIERPNDPAFDRYFTSSHMNYLVEARDRMAELAAMPGPIYTIGLSTGGSVALGLAASAPDRVKRVVAYAPLLEVYGEERRQYVELTGPLDIAEMGWDPALQFPVGCLTAADRFGGSYVCSRTSIQTLKSIPTFLVLTENEDAADIKTNQRFFQDIGGTNNRHRYHLYRAQDMVPHPMVDPTEVSQGMSNQFWKSLYQETFRFLTQGEVSAANMASLSLAADLPAVPDVI
ncbi:alpha/beta fold hydrolase [Pseudanabaena sp. FACHB-2040]|nr:alpha/beta fold hydrolase [Pseudanabaena sp. FACHB-2040]